jgi:hypothetical protein
MNKHVRPIRRARTATAIALAGIAAVAGCRDKGSLIRSETTTTAAEVERRQAELPKSGVVLNGAAETSSEGAASGAMGLGAGEGAGEGAGTGGTESPTPGGPSDRLGNDPLDANRAPVAGPERMDMPKAKDAGH